MKYFSAQNIALLLTLALSAPQVQASEYVIEGQALEYHTDPCLVSEFGAKSSYADLQVAVNTAPLAKVIDAFINCPGEMSYVYLEKLATQGPGAIVSAIKANAKIGAFYDALRSTSATVNVQPPVSMELAKRELTRQAIYGESFYQDIPEAYYIDLLKQNSLGYTVALLDKAMTCHTPESKEWIVNLLKEVIARINVDPASPVSAEGIAFIDMIHVAINMIIDEPIDFDAINPQSKSGIVFLALGFNRPDVAEAVGHGMVINKFIAINFLYGKYSKHVADIEGACAILANMLSTDEDREEFTRAKIQWQQARSGE